MTTLALLPLHLTKAFVRGHLRNLGGRAVEVKPYHTKTRSRRDDERTRELFGDIPPADNQPQPRMHPVRTTEPRTPIVPFRTLFPQLFGEKEVDSGQNGQYNKDIKGRNPAPATEGKKMDRHGDPIHGYTDSVAQLEEDRAQTRKLRREMADAKAAEDADWTEATTEQRRRTWNEWLKQANGRKLSAKEIAEQEKRQGFTLDTLKRHIARHGVDKRHAATKATLLKEMEKDRKAAEGTPIAEDIETVIDLVRMTDPENRPFSETIKGKWSKGEEAAFERFQAWKKEQNAKKSAVQSAAPTTPPGIANPLTEQEGKAFGKKDRIYLAVPFAEKDRAKAKGAKWDSEQKKWYWPTNAGGIPTTLESYREENR